MIDKTRLIEAIHACKGNVSKAASLLGCSGRAIYKRRKQDTDIADAITEARFFSDVELLDLAESKLLEHVEAGNWWAIKFVLSTKGRSRGYGQKYEIDHATAAVPIVFEMNLGLEPNERLEDHSEVPKIVNAN